MKVLQLLARYGIVMTMAVLAGGAMAAPAAADQPCPSVPVAADECDDPPPPPSPPPSPPGPLTREVVLHDTNPHALPAARARLDELLDRVAPANRARQWGRTFTIHVIPADVSLTELPLWTHLRDTDVPDRNPDDDYIEQRHYNDMRGSNRGCNRPALDVAVGAETLVSLPNAPYPSPSVDLGASLFHETGHLIQCLLTPLQATKLEELYDDAFARRYDGILGNSAYVVSTRNEYWAEGTVAWFEARSHESYRRAWLQVNDPGLYALLDEVYDVPPAPRFCDGVRTTAVVTSSSPFVGTAGQDVVAGSSGRNVIDAAGGDDLVCGEGGADTLAGGPGVDYLAGGPGADQLRGGDGDDIDLVGGSGDDQIHGDNGNDELWGDADNDALYGDGGADRLNGSTGNDTLDGGDGADTLYGGDQDDTLDGGDGADYLEADDGADHLVGNSGDDQLHGNDGDDRYSGGPGNDWLTERYSVDADVMFGGEGQDTLEGGPGNDILNDSDGIDILDGGAGFDQLFAVERVPWPPQKGGPDHLDGGYDPQNPNNECTADPNDIVQNCSAPGEG